MVDVRIQWVIEQPEFFSGPLIWLIVKFGFISLFFSFFQMDLAGLLLKAGVKNYRVTLLLTDAEILDDRFLVIVNNILASGQIQDPCYLCSFI